MSLRVDSQSSLGGGATSESLAVVNLADFVPLFGRAGYVNSRSAFLNESRMRWMLRGEHARGFVESGALVFHAGQWYAHPELLDAELLRVGQDNARRLIGVSVCARSGNA